MTEPIEMVKGDLKPSIKATLTYKDGSIVDLTSCSVKFHMKKDDGTLLIDKTATILNPPTDGRVQYDWASGETNVTGLCKVEFEVTFADTKKQTFPAGEPFDIVFREENA